MHQSAQSPRRSKAGSRSIWLERTMPLPLQISFRGIDPSEFLEEEVRRRSTSLERFADRIVACKVALESSHHRQHKGNLYHVRIDITVPGKEVVVSRDPPANHAHEDMHVAIRDAFNAARRQLEDHSRKRNGAVKLHEAPLMARVATLFPERGYGFLSTDGGEEVYMHRNAVLNGGFDKLSVGDRVRYVLALEPGEKGVQASTVEPIHHSHRV